MLRALRKAIYPSRCICCGDLVEDEFGLCGRCWKETPVIDGLVCDQCGAPLPGESDVTVRCDNCLKIARPWARGRAALLYEENGRKFVLGFKNGQRHDLAIPCARWMVRAGKPLVSPDMLATPMPLHWSRLLRRRFNQSARLGERIARELQIGWLPDALIRGKSTQKLDGLNREERFRTLSEAIQPSKKRQSQIAGRKVLLIDDVMTTGASLGAATDALLAGGAKEVYVLVLARVAKAS